MREIDLTADQRADLLSFVRDDGKGFVAAHSGATAFFSWPEFGDMLGGRFDEHPWDIVAARVVVDDPDFPAMKGLPSPWIVRDEHYQLKDFSRDKLRVLARIDPSSVDLKRPLVHRADGDFPVAWAKTYGAGRVFYSTLGHERALWDTPPIQQSTSTPSAGRSAWWTATRPRGGSVRDRAAAGPSSASGSSRAGPGGDARSAGCPSSR